MEKYIQKISKQKILKYSFKNASRLLVLFIIYFITAKIGLKFDAVSGFATFVWPPTGIAIAAILIFGYDMWPAIFVGAFLVNLTTGAPLLVALGIAFGNTLEAVIGIFFLRKFGFTGSQKSLKDVLLFIVFGAILSAALAATIGVSSLLLGQVIAQNSYGATWIAWFVGDVLGALIVGNLILACARGFSLRKFGVFKFFEIISLFCVVIFFDLAIFTGFFGYTATQYQNYVFSYLIFLPLMWASIRFGPGVSASTVFITSILAIWGTTLGTGPFIIPELSSRLFLLQGYMAIVSITGMVLAAVIAERFKTEQELRNEKNKDEAILESVGEGVVVISTSGIVVLMNPAAQAMLKVDTDFSIGRSYERVVQIETLKGEPVPNTSRPFNLALTSNRVVSNKYYFIRADKSKFPVALTTAPILLDNKTVGVIDVFRDITYEMGIDKEKSEFVSLASHQLRTPLTTMKWYSHSLLETNGDHLSQKERDYVKEIYHNNQRMIELVNSLLNVSRIELGNFIIKPIPCKLEILSAGIIHDFKLEAQNRKIVIKEEYQADLPIIDADPDLLRIIFQNLISNSLKYSPKNTSITVKIKKDGTEIVISVEDMGCGIPDSQRDKIFTKLFRTDIAKSIDPEGSGLGLYMVKSIADTIGGRAWFTSKVDQGTTFYVALPEGGMQRRENGPRLIYS